MEIYTKRTLIFLIFVFSGVHTRFYYIAYVT